MTATVRPPASRVAAWAAPSMPTRQPGHDARAGRRQRRGHPRRKGATRIRSLAACPTTAIACSASRAAGSPSHEQEVRRQVDRGESRRVGRVLDGHDAQAQRPDAVQRPIGILGRPDDLRRDLGRQRPAAGHAVGRLLRRCGDELRLATDRAGDAQDVAPRPAAVGGGSRTRPARVRAPRRGRPRRLVPRLDRRRRPVPPWRSRRGGRRERPVRADAQHLSAPGWRRDVPPARGTRRPHRDALR